MKLLRSVPDIVTILLSRLQVRLRTWSLHDTRGPFTSLTKRNWLKYDVKGGKKKVY